MLASISKAKILLYIIVLVLSIFGCLFVYSKIESVFTFFGFNTKENLQKENTQLKLDVEQITETNNSNVDTLNKKKQEGEVIDEQVNRYTEKRETKRKTFKKLKDEKSLKPVSSEENIDFIWNVYCLNNPSEKECAGVK